MPEPEDNIGRASEENDVGKRKKQAKVYPTMPKTTPITSDSIDPKAWAEVSKKLNTLKPVRSMKKSPK